LRTMKKKIRYFINYK